MLHPQPLGLQIPQGVYPNPNYGGGGVWYYLHFLYTYYEFLKFTLYIQVMISQNLPSLFALFCHKVLILRGIMLFLYKGSKLKI